MNALTRNAYASLPLSREDVERFYAVACKAFANNWKRLCHSHERLRLENEGLESQVEEIRQEITNVLLLMDGLAEVWGDEGVFRRCRDRLRKLVAPNDKGA